MSISAKPIVELLAEAIRDADRYGTPDIEPALLATADDLDESWLDCKTVTPSGKTVGIVRLGSARLFLDEHGLELVDGEMPSVEREYEVDVYVDVYTGITVTAEDELDAEDMVREMFVNGDIDYDLDVHVRERKLDKPKKGAA